MEIGCINRSTGKFKNQKLQLKVGCNGVNSAPKTYHISAKDNAGKKVSFGRISGKLVFKNLSNCMANISEITNSVIIAIGTGLIAPFAIMCSPKKPCSNSKPVDEKKDKEKKFFQAVRQPISAGLAFAFSMVTIFLINKILDYGSYKAQWKLLKDEGLQGLIPDEKYLKKQAKKVFNGKANAELNAEWANELRLVQNETQIKAELKERIRRSYDDIGITLDEATLDKKASSKGAIKKFKIAKMIELKQEKLKSEKIAELRAKPPVNLNEELITENYQKQVRETFSSKFETLKKDANLKWYDKLLKRIGIHTKRVTALEKAETDIINTEGLKLVKKDMGEAFFNEAEKIKQYIKVRTPKAQLIFKNKRFWITLVPNLFMIAMSCIALNKLHPKLAAFIDKCRGKNPEQTPSAEKKVEVSTCR